jgi:hypothetical protein
MTDWLIMTARAFRMHFDRVKCLLRHLFYWTTPDSFGWPRFMSDRFRRGDDLMKRRFVSGRRLGAPGEALECWTPEPPDEHQTKRAR